MSNEELLKKVRDAGVIGAGGAGFPTYVKLNAQVDCIIANGAECEPLLYKDRECMIQDREAMIRGLEIMQELTGAKRVVIAVKKKNEDVLDAYAEDLKRTGFESFVYPDVYPAGDEYVLVYEITGKRIPPGGLPLHVGCIVDNVETIVNVALAVDGESVTQKYVTVTGEVANPMTTTFPVGTTFRDCIEAAGGLTTDNPTVLTGGVMMGGCETDLDLPVTKALGGLIVLPSDHYLARRKGEPKETYQRVGHGQCDQCSMCTELCPRYIMGYPIEPHRVMRTLLMTGEEKARVSMWAQYCCECNVCTYIACPESLDPKNICVDSKALLREQDIGRSEVELETLFRDVHPARKGREIPIQKLYTRLGLRPYDKKAPWAAGKPSGAKVKIPLDTHVGPPAKASVSVGDAVKSGDVVGTVADDALGCPVHASVSGTVAEIAETAVILSVN